MRINAVIALSVPPERRYYGNSYIHVYTALIESLKGTEKITDFSEFKYRDTLRQQVWSQGYHSLCSDLLLHCIGSENAGSPVLSTPDIFPAALPVVASGFVGFCRVLAIAKIFTIGKISFDW